MTVLVDEFQYDNFGRMKYHPEIHFSHGKPFTEVELEYICKYHEVDDLKTLAFAIGKTEMTVATRITLLKKEGKFQYYRRLNKHWGYLNEWEN